MTWIKRNLFFVIGVAIGLGLTGYCGYLLYTSLNANSSVTDDYNQTRDNLKAMQDKNPFPSDENIKEAQQDQERVRQFLADFRKSFAAFPKPPVVDQKGFKSYLEDSLVRFRAEATNAGVELPPDFGFTFSGLMGKLTYPPENLQPWMEQFQEISTILDILYKAKINYLAGLCRVPISPDDVGTGDCMLPTTSVTNETGVITPYKITFRGFSTEIAAVLEGFARASNCFIVKSVDVVADAAGMPAASSLGMPAAMPAFPFAPAAPVRMPAPGMADRYGDRGASGRMRAMPVAPAPVYAAPSAVPAGPTGPVTILSETPLLVTIAVDAIKLKVSEH